MYPALYDIDKYIPYFNTDIKTLSPELISNIINTSSIDI